MSWFDVDKDGLAKLLRQRGPGFAVLELLQNAWDQKVSRVEVHITRLTPGSPFVTLTVTDDDPDGFADLKHAYTLFAESRKKGDPEKRGRFNLGEKLVIACCRDATISTTTGTVHFDSDGRRRHAPSQRRLLGSEFVGQIRMSNDELRETLRNVRATIVPLNIETRLNGDRLAPRTPVAQWEQALPTVVADDEGYLVRTTRTCVVEAFEPLPDEDATIFELGIPVVETYDRFHINVKQKVPLTMDRTNVPPSYLAHVRTGCLNATAHLLDGTEATSTWVKEATGHKDAAPEAVKQVMDLRFGEKRVAYDPSDPEANKLAVMEGYTVVHGGVLSAHEWRNVKAGNFVPPAGQVTPSPKPFSADGSPLRMVESPTDAMVAFVMAVRTLAREFAGLPDAIVALADDPAWGYAGCYGGRRFIFNVAAFGGAQEFFVCGWTERLLACTIHELAHVKVSDHMTCAFYDECCRIGARLALAHMEGHA